MSFSKSSNGGVYTYTIDVARYDTEDNGRMLIGSNDEFAQFVVDTRSKLRTSHNKGDNNKMLILVSNPKTPLLQKPFPEARSVEVVDEAGKVVVEWGVDFGGLDELFRFIRKYGLQDRGYEACVWRSHRETTDGRPLWYVEVADDDDDDDDDEVLAAILDIALASNGKTTNVSAGSTDGNVVDTE